LLNYHFDKGYLQKYPILLNKLKYVAILQH